MGPCAVVTSPWFGVLDVALPLLAHFARPVAFVHVPMHYVLDAHSRRAHFLAELQNAGRLLFVGNLPLGPLHRRCMWVGIFHTAEAREQARMGLAPERRVSWSPLHLIHPGWQLPIANPASNLDAGRLRGGDEDLTRDLSKSASITHNHDSCHVQHTQASSGENPREGAKGGEGQEAGPSGIGQEARPTGGKGMGRKEVRFADGS